MLVQGIRRRELLSASRTREPLCTEVAVCDVSVQGLLRGVLFSALVTKLLVYLEVGVGDVFGDASEPQFTVASRETAFHDLGV